MLNLGIDGSVGSKQGEEVVNLLDGDSVRHTLGGEGLLGLEKNRLQMFALDRFGCSSGVGFRWAVAAMVGMQGIVLLSCPAARGLCA